MPGKIEQHTLGRVWKRIPIKRGVAILTNEGVELIGSLDGILHWLHRYKSDIKNDTQDTRIELAEGGNGKVYTVGDLDLVIKEQSNSLSFERTLERMQILYVVLNEAKIDWLAIPKHYGIITSYLLDKEYMLIEKVDNGINLEDLEEYPDIDTKKQVAIQTYFRPYISVHSGKVVDTVIDSIKEMFELAYNRVVELLERNNLNPDEFLVDWRERNVLFYPEPDLISLENPYGLKLWIIDQN